MRNLIGMTALTGSLSMLIMIKMMIKMVMKEWIFPISSDLSRTIVPPSGTNAITPSDPTASSLSSTIPGLDSSPASSPVSVSLLGKSSSHTTNICSVTAQSGIQTCGTDNNDEFIYIIVQNCSIQIFMMTMFMRNIVMPFALQNVLKGSQIG